MIVGNFLPNSTPLTSRTSAKNSLWVATWAGRSMPSNGGSLNALMLGQRNTRRNNFYWHGGRLFGTGLAQSPPWSASRSLRHGIGGQRTDQRDTRPDRAQASTDARGANVRSSPLVTFCFGSAVANDGPAQSGSSQSRRRKPLIPTPNDRSRRWEVHA